MGRPSQSEPPEKSRFSASSTSAGCVATTSVWCQGLSAIPKRAPSPGQSPTLCHDSVPTGPSGRGSLPAPGPAVGPGPGVVSWHTGIRADEVPCPPSRTSALSLLHRVCDGSSPPGAGAPSQMREPRDVNTRPRCEPSSGDALSEAAARLGVGTAPRARVLGAVLVTAGLQVN